jgi:hypothetical protein
LSVEGKKGRGSPRELEPSESEEDEVQEETDDGSLESVLGSDTSAGHDDEHGNGLASRSDQEELATSEALDGEERDEGGKGVDGDIDSTEL